MATTLALPHTTQLTAGLRMLGNETNKGLRVMWVHKAPLVFQLAMMSVTYWIMQFFIGGGRFVDDVLAMTLAGYLAYVVSYITMLRMVAGTLEEMYTGTLEQSLLSPLRPWVQSTGRLAAALVEAVVTAAAVVAAFLVLYLFVGVELTWRWSALVPIVITLADLAGFAMLIGGVALIVNSIGAIVHVLQSFIMFFNGAFIPVFVFPDWLEIAAKIAVPTALGADATRQTLVDGESLGHVWADGGLSWGLVHAVLLLVLGWTAYQAAIRRGLREGRLGA